MNVWWDKVNWKPFVAGWPVASHSGRRFLVSDDYGFRGPRFSYHWSSQQCSSSARRRRLTTGIHTSRSSLPPSEVSIGHLCCVTSLRTRSTCNIDWHRLKRAKFNLYRILLINVWLLLWSIDCQHLSIFNVLN